jgi:hypothetical protein
MELRFRIYVQRTTAFMTLVEYPSDRKSTENESKFLDMFHMDIQ